MNCKQGDLAITRIPFGRLNGKFATVLALGRTGDNDRLGCWVVPHDSGGPAWFIKLHQPVTLDGILYDEFLFYDKYLCPIRDPGEDAIDEMVRGVSCEVNRTGEVRHG